MARPHLSLISRMVSRYRRNCSRSSGVRWPVQQQKECVSKRHDGSTNQQGRIQCKRGRPHTTDNKRVGATSSTGGSSTSQGSKMLRSARGSMMPCTSESNAAVAKQKCSTNPQRVHACNRRHSNSCEPSASFLPATVDAKRHLVNARPRTLVAHFSPRGRAAADRIMSACQKPRVSEIMMASQEQHLQHRLAVEADHLHHRLARSFLRQTRQDKSSVQSDPSGRSGCRILFGRSAYCDDTSSDAPATTTCSWTTPVADRHSQLTRVHKQKVARPAFTRRLAIACVNSTIVILGQSTQTGNCGEQAGRCF